MTILYPVIEFQARFEPPTLCLYLYKPATPWNKPNKILFCDVDAAGNANRGQARTNHVITQDVYVAGNVTTLPVGPSVPQSVLQSMSMPRLYTAVMLFAL